MHHAVANGHRDFTKLLCDFSGDPELILEAKDLTGATPIFSAVRYNQEECIKILLSFDVDLFVRKKNGDNLLHEAAAFNSVESILLVSTYGGLELVK